MSPDLSNLPEEKRQHALLHVLQVASTRSSQFMVYAATLGAIALIPRDNVPAMLASIATGVGFNLLSDMMRRVAEGKQVSNGELLAKIEAAVAESHVDQFLTSNEFQRAIGRLFRRQDHLGYAIKQSEFTIARQLTEQYGQYQLIFEEMRDEFLSISQGLDRVATQEQSDAAIALLHRILRLLDNDREQTTQFPELRLKLYKMGRDQARREEILFETHRSLPQHHQFGFALENTTESTMAKGIYIRVVFSWRGHDIFKAPSFRAPRYKGWAAKVSQLVCEQPAVLTFGDPDLPCFYGQPIEWDNVRLTLPEHMNGYLLVHYKVSSVQPHTENSGELRIVLGDG